MRDELEGKTVLVTGGAGSIGSEIVKQLLDYNVSAVIVLSRDEIKHFVMKKRIGDSRLKTVVGNVSDYRSLERAFEKYKIDIIYNTAAMKHVVVCEDFPIECIKTNIIGTQNVVDLALRYNVPKLVNISTDKAACPVNVMGASKFIAERIVLSANYTCVRFGNVANSRGSVIPIFIDNLLNKKPIAITDPDVTRFIIEIPDAVRLVMKSTKHSRGGEIFILKMRAFKLGDLLKVIVERIAPRLGISREEIKIETIGLVIGEKLHEDLINNLELTQLHELEDMYLILKDKRKILDYKGIEKIDLPYYSSDKVELITEDELEKIIMNYLEKAHS